MTAEESSYNEEKPRKNILNFGAGDNLISVPSPEASKRRRCTDIPFLIIFALVFVFLISLSGICSKGTSINRFLYGYDKCGDTCGVNNSRINGINCSGKDLTHNRIAMMRYHHKCGCSKTKIVLADECVSCCKPPNQLIFHRCYPPCKVTLDPKSSAMKQATEILHALNESLTIIAIMGITGIGALKYIVIQVWKWVPKTVPHVYHLLFFLCVRVLLHGDSYCSMVKHLLSLVILICFGFNVSVTFWTLIIFQFVVLLTSTTLLWHKYATVSDNIHMLILLFAISATAYLIFLVIFIVFFHHKFALIFAFYEEAMNAIFRIPSLLIQPLITITAIIVALTSMVFLAFLISSNEQLTLNNQHNFIAQYVPKASNMAYVLFAMIVMIWIYELVDGCQTVIVSGAISTFYFTRIKSDLRAPYSTSISILVRYHLGSVTLGSLIVTVFAFMRGIAVYVVNKAYIQTAMHGTSLYKSTTVAAKLLSSDLTNTAVLTGLNYVVISGCSFLGVLLSVIIGILMNPSCSYTNFFWMGLLFGAVTTGLATFVVMGVINVASETIFMCFCEDRIMNDGKSRPYYMSDKLQKIFETLNHSNRIENF